MKKSEIGVDFLVNEDAGKESLTHHLPEIGI